MNAKSFFRENPYARPMLSTYWGESYYLESGIERSKRLLKHLRIMNRRQRRSEQARTIKTGNRGSNRKMTSGRLKHRMSNMQWKKWRAQRQSEMQFSKTQIQ